MDLGRSDEAGMNEDQERDAARERVKGWMKDHQRPVHGPDDEKTRDDKLDDPKHNKGDDE